MKIFKKLNVESVKLKIFEVLTISNNSYIRNLYWNLRVKEIHSKWGGGDGDYETVGKIILKTNSKTILDIGCGSGRLFKLYESLNLSEVVAQDISVAAINLCKDTYSFDYKYELDEVENLNYPENYFDLIISNKVLSAILPSRIERMVEKLTLLGKNIYVNEVMGDDPIKNSNYWFKHNYDPLMLKNGFVVFEKGQIVKNQTWKLYKKTT